MPGSHLNLEIIPTRKTGLQVAGSVGLHMHNHPQLPFTSIRVLQGVELWGGDAGERTSAGARQTHQAHSHISALNHLPYVPSSSG